MPEWHFKLLYDGQCPFCRLEVEWLNHLNSKGHLAFEDISAPNFNPSQYGVTQEDLMGVLHGVFPDGRLVTRIEAFREAYRALGLGWLVAPTEWLILRWIFDRLYDLFARYRIPLGRLFGRDCKTGTCYPSATKK